MLRGSNELHRPYVATASSRIRGQRCAGAAAEGGGGEAGLANEGGREGRSWRCMDGVLRAGRTLRGVGVVMARVHAIARWRTEMDWASKAGVGGRVQMPAE